MSVSFVYQANLLNDISISDGNIPIELLFSTTGVADFEFMFLKTASDYSILSYFNKADYTEEFIRSFIDTYINAVHGMIYSDTLGEIPLTDEKSKAQIDGFNRTEKEYDTEKTVVDLFRVFTANVLYRLGFLWSLVDNAYLDRAINGMLTLDYFGMDDIDGEQV